jgi:glycerol-3-phosphate O-acyltransferase / dihydroxyacetone phosphate acyltransferase
MERKLHRIASFCVGLYYRRRRLGGEVPGEGPVLLVGNHPNGLVDPVVLADATDRPVSFLGKAPLFDLPILGRVVRGFGVLPVWRAQDGDDTGRNEQTFRAVFERLGEGRVVCLFPEGASHSDPELRRLKTGAARIALGAEARRDFRLGVRIVPVGLVYRSKRRFRSRAATWVGEPIELGDLAGSFAEDERGTVRRVTERIDAGLREVTLNLDRWEDLPLLELAERLWRGDGEGSLVGMKRFADQVRRLREEEPETIDALAFRISCFRDRLAALRLSLGDLEVPRTRVTVAGFALRTLLRLAIGLPLAVVGGLFWVLPYRLVALVRRRVAPSEEVTATVHLLAAIVLFPAWLVTAVMVIGVELNVRWALLGLLGLPILGLHAHAFFAWWTETRGDLSAFLRLGQRRHLRELLLRQRDELSARIEAIAERMRGEGKSDTQRDTPRSVTLDRRDATGPG